MAMDQPAASRIGLSQPAMSNALARLRHTNPEHVAEQVSRAYARLVGGQVA